MTQIIGGQVWCPLCEEQMSRREVMMHNKRATIFFCRPCEVGIFDFDPAFNKWRDADKDIPCSTCGFARVKWFIRYMDGFFKSVCPSCKTVMKKDGDVKFGKGGNIIVPEDMEQDEVEEPVELKIPMKHLIKKLGRDKVNELIAKRQKNQG